MLVKYFAFRRDNGGWDMWQQNPNGKFEYVDWASMLLEGQEGWKRPGPDDTAYIEDDDIIRCPEFVTWCHI